MMTIDGCKSLMISIMAANALLRSPGQKCPSLPMMTGPTTLSFSARKPFVGTSILTRLAGCEIVFRTIPCLRSMFSRRALTPRRLRPNSFDTADGEPRRFQTSMNS